MILTGRDKRVEKRHTKQESMEEHRYGVRRP